MSGLSSFGPIWRAARKLDEVLHKHRKLPARNVVQMALQLATCLQPYHEHGLFHGLLKPSDVLIGTNGRVAVLDFGVGFVLTSERGKAILDTMTNSKAMAKGLDSPAPNRSSTLWPARRPATSIAWVASCIGV